MAEFEKVVIVTKKTALEELVERFNTREQARFYLEHMGVSFVEYELSHQVYSRALSQLKRALPSGVRSQVIERSFVPNVTFGPHDLVVALGPDGLVVNTAKYLAGQPLLAINPDPQRIDGVLLPFQVDQAAQALSRVLRGSFSQKLISMAQASLNDGQTIYAVNDLFIGQQTHVSARYRLDYRGSAEQQSSSGIIVSTGAGSTGWFRSVVTGASRVMDGLSQEQELEEQGHWDVQERYRFGWESSYLYFTVREPFISKISGANLVFGRIEAGETLEVLSSMPQNGVIFGDGVETDYLQFNSGTIASIGLADKRLHLIMEYE